MVWSYVWEYCPGQSGHCLLLNSKDVEDHWLDIMRARQKLAEDLRLEFDEVVFFKEKKIKALAEMQPYPDESLSMYASAANGLSIFGMQAQHSRWHWERNGKEKSRTGYEDKLIISHSIATGDQGYENTSRQLLWFAVSVFCLVCFVFYGHVILQEDYIAIIKCYNTQASWQ